MKIVLAEDGYYICNSAGLHIQRVLFMQIQIMFIIKNIMENLCNFNMRNLLNFIQITELKVRIVYFNFREIFEI